MPAGATKDEENRLLNAALNRPVDTGTTFQTGGDVSRFQLRAWANKPKPASNMARMPLAPSGPAAPSGPSVRVTRGQTTTVEQPRN